MVKNFSFIEEGDIITPDDCAGNFAIVTKKLSREIEILWDDGSQGRVGVYNLLSDFSVTGKNKNLEFKNFLKEIKK